MEKQLKTYLLLTYGLGCSINFDKLHQLQYMMW